MNKAYISYKKSEEKLLTMSKNTIDKIYQKIKLIIDTSDYQLGYPGTVICNNNEKMLDILKYSTHLLINNIGDPSKEYNAKSHTKEYERDVISYFAKLYNIANNHWGYITNGGTEGNLYGIFTGREILKKRGKPICFLTSDKTHYSLIKCSKILNIDTILVKTNIYGEMDYDALRSKINNNVSYIININIGTTMNGAIDSISKIVDAFLKAGCNDYYIHADAALFGSFYPYMKNYENLFSLGCGSLSISGHKFLRIPIVSGICLTKKENNDLLTKSYEKVQYINSIDNTISGSRSGILALLFWARLFDNNFDIENEYKFCVNNAKYFLGKMRKIKNSNVLYNEEQIIVTFRKPSKSICQKYQLATEGTIAHIVFMQDLKKEIIDEFLLDYESDNFNTSDSFKQR